METGCLHQILERISNFRNKVGASTLEGRYAERAFKNDYVEGGTGIAYIHLNMEPEEPGIKLPISVRSRKKQENTRKTPTSTLLIMPKSLTV